MRIIVKGVGEITIAFSGSFLGHLEILHVDLYYNGSKNSHKPSGTERRKMDL